MAIVDAQSVKGDAPQSEHGYDAGNKVNDRKRPLAVAIERRLLAADIPINDVQDQDRGIPLVQRLAKTCPFIKTMVAGGGDRNRFIETIQTTLGRAAEVVKRPEFAKGFVPLPKRWPVEQSIGALTISPRLKIDYDTLMAGSAPTILFALIGRLPASITTAWPFPNTL